MLAGLSNLFNLFDFIVNIYTLSCDILLHGRVGTERHLVNEVPAQFPLMWGITLVYVVEVTLDHMQFTWSLRTLCSQA